MLQFGKCSKTGRCSSRGPKGSTPNDPQHTKAFKSFSNSRPSSVGPCRPRTVRWVGSHSLLLRRPNQTQRVCHHPPVMGPWVHGSMIHSIQSRKEEAAIPGHPDQGCLIAPFGVIRGVHDPPLRRGPGIGALRKTNVVKDFPPPRPPVWSRQHPTTSSCRPDNWALFRAMPSYVFGPCPPVKD